VPDKIELFQKLNPKFKYNLTRALAISLAVTPRTCMYNLGSLQINYTLNDVMPTHTLSESRRKGTEKGERQQRCNQQNYTKIQSKKKGEK